LLDLAAAVPAEVQRYIRPVGRARSSSGCTTWVHRLIRQRAVPAILNDFNGELMTVYQVVKIPETDRGWRGIKRTSTSRLLLPSAISIASRTQAVRCPCIAAIFLNKTGYNGLYRVNQSGYFNVPCGRYRHPTVLDHAALKAAHQALQRVDLMSSDFAQPLRLARKGDFIYIDPPYQPLSHTANFTAYTTRGFCWSEQERLARWLARVARRGCYVLINNADTPEVRELYRAAFEERGVPIRMQSFETARSINSAPGARGGGRELTVWNY
jgi:DNA adenine methylase